MKSVLVAVVVAAVVVLSGCRSTSSMGEPEGTAHPGTGQEAEPVDSVSFTFAWPAGLTASVHATREKYTSTGTRTDSSFSESNFVMEVRDHPEGLAVRYWDFDIPGLDTVAAEAQDLFDLLTGALPEHIVSREGTLVRLTGIDEFAAGMREMLTEAIAQPRSLQPSTPAADSLRRAVDDLLATFMSEESLTDLASGDWNMQVGFWLGGFIEIGTWYTLDVDAPNPLLGNAVIPHQIDFVVEERVPCTPAESVPDCVSTYVEITPNADAFADAMVEFMTRLNPEAEEHRAALREIYLSFEVIVSYSLVTEPETLIPHSFTQIREAYGSMGAEESWKWDEKRIEYTYY